MVCISVYYIGKMCNLVIAGFLRRVIIGQSRMTRNSLSFQSHDLNYNKQYQKISGSPQRYNCINKALWFKMLIFQSILYDLFINVNFNVYILILIDFQDWLTKGPIKHLNLIRMGDPKWEDVVLEKDWWWAVQICLSVIALLGNVLFIITIIYNR